MLRSNKGFDMSKAIKWVNDLEEKVDKEKDLAIWYIEKVYGTINHIKYCIYKDMVEIILPRGTQVYVFLDKIARMMKAEGAN